MASYLQKCVIIFEVRFFLREEGRLERPLCFREFVPSPFCEGVRFPDRSKGLLRTYVPWCPGKTGIGVDTC